jgi:transcriptional regulator
MYCPAHFAESRPEVLHALMREYPLATLVTVRDSGPDAHITPSWYPSKREHGKAVPTWNYATVHARGPLRFSDDADWLRAHVDTLTRQQESTFAEPWAVSDAPADYLEKMLAAIVGIELTITALEGKWKASQNQPQANRDGVAAGLRERGRADAAALIKRG